METRTDIIHIKSDIKSTSEKSKETKIMSEHTSKRLDELGSTVLEHTNFIKGIPSIKENIRSQDKVISKL